LSGRGASRKETRILNIYALRTQPASRLYAYRRREVQRRAANDGGGNSSGLGEFWNMELAKNGFPSLPFLALAFALRPWMKARNSSDASAGVDEGSSKVKTPSLGARW
jgi:hypothetical protein